MCNAIEWNHLKMGFFYGCTCRETDRLLYCYCPVPLYYFYRKHKHQVIGGIRVSSLLNEKSKSIDIDSNLKLVTNEEDKGKNFTVRIGEINPKEKEKEEQTTSEAKLGSVKFEKKNDWFSRLKLK